jgi:hypothetical protein
MNGANELISKKDENWMVGAYARSPRIMMDPFSLKPINLKMFL